MRRRTEFLICKRDGRREWLRASKLVRSISQALESVEGSESAELAFELATVVIRAMRKRAEMIEPVWPPEPSSCLCSAAELSAAAERVLFVSGHPQAALCFAGLRDERALRRSRTAACPAERSSVALVAAGPQSGPPGVRARVTFDHN